MDRIKQLIAYLRGDCIVLSLHGEQLHVDSGNVSKDKLPAVANKFFNKVYNL